MTVTMKSSNLILSWLLLQQKPNNAAKAKKPRIYPECETSGIIAVD